MYTISTHIKKITSLYFVFVLLAASLTLAAPHTSFASVQVFGGKTGKVIPCFNNVIWTNVSDPRGGKFIWAPGITDTYDYGPPKHGGQWLLGLYGAPYFCIVSPWPLIIFPGKLMIMLGSST